MPRLSEPEAHEQAKSYLANLEQLTELSKIGQKRDYSPEQLDNLWYSEDSLATLRKMARGEQVNSKLLHPQTYDLIFDNIVAFVEKHDK